MLNSQRSDIPEKIWQFLRGDLPSVEFERWVHETPELEKFCGPALFQQLISVDYRNWLTLGEVTESLEDWVDKRYPRNCDCITWANDEKFHVCEDTANLLTGFETPKKRNPWLKLVRCARCGTYWYLGEDIDDLYYYLHRLKAEDVERIVASDEWPDCYDNIEPFLSNK